MNYEGTHAILSDDDKKEISALVQDKSVSWEYRAHWPICPLALQEVALQAVTDIWNRQVQEWWCVLAGDLGKRLKKTSSSINTKGLCRRCRIDHVDRHRDRGSLWVWPFSLCLFTNVPLLGAETNKHLALMHPLSCWDWRLHDHDKDAQAGHVGQPSCNRNTCNLCVSLSHRQLCCCSLHLHASYSVCAADWCQSNAADEGNQLTVCRCPLMDGAEVGWTTNACAK